MDFPQPQAAALGFVDASALLFADGAARNPRKRGRDSIGVPMAVAPLQQSLPSNLSSLQPQPSSSLLPPPPLVSLAQLCGHPPPLVSTGLRLSSSSSSLLSDGLAARVNHHTNAIESFLYDQGEQLRQTLEERRRRHYLSLLGELKKSAALRLRQKEADVERAARRRAELEDRIARLRTESMAWQTKAIAGQAAAASLHAQLQQAAAIQPPAKAYEPEEDAESVFVDPDRVESERACRACRWRLASVVLLPCRHLCLCDSCDCGGGGGTALSCPVCRCVRTGSVSVFLP
ncbi:BOI-related E3 ubiquitin-protein ligase 1-like [Canna indica]|uniref:BOI-related E3 ubiquitin-protein ligase 1-like n=1 Tax=Canna indica TaxID=4628 RepID=A0AAQ3K2H7_9LILI|nr:BOI-related E3 ubiquitin-protein ligase 1-like [Canna indica]